MQNKPVIAPVGKTDAEINAIATDALAWAQGSWGQGRYDSPRYDKETMLRIYSALAVLALAEAERLAFKTEL